MYKKSIAECVGATPLVRLSGVEKKYSLGCTLLAKLEYMNPAGSSKDRVALEMLSEMEDGAVIIEPTSGNTGIGLAAMGVMTGRHVILTMPDTMSSERIRTLKAYGAEVELTPGAEGMAGAVRRAHELQAQIKGSVIPDQFSSKLNPLAHYKTTAPEIFEALGCVPDAFVAGVGTGGTISGTMRFFREHGTCRGIAVEPDTSAVLSGGKSGAHKLQGIGAGFVPGALDVSAIDEIVPVSYENAREAARAVAVSDGIFVGVSSGAALWGAICAGKKMPDKTVVVLFPDSGAKYLSTDLFE